MDVDKIIADARVRTDDDGNPIVEMATCGTCGRSWNDAAISSLTPTPAGRCPWEYDHDNTGAMPPNIQAAIDLLAIWGAEHSRANTREERDAVRDWIAGAVTVAVTEPDYEQAL